MWPGFMVRGPNHNAGLGLGRKNAILKCGHGIAFCEPNSRGQLVWEETETRFGRRAQGPAKPSIASELLGPIKCVFSASKKKKQKKLQISVLQNCTHIQAGCRPGSGSQIHQVHPGSIAVVDWTIIPREQTCAETTDQ